MSGLRAKYDIRKGGKPLDGPAFVLRYDRDPAARLALVKYADATDNLDLKRDLRAALVASRPAFEAAQKALEDSA